MRCAVFIAAAIASANSVCADEGVVPLFNGTDLSGWVVVNVAPETFTVRDEMIVSTGKPTGVIRTERQYENFILELEWRHMVAGGNAGLFVWSDPLTAVGVPFTRSIEVQILDGRNSENYTSHGDIFSIHGATLTPNSPHPAGWARSLPSEHRCKPAGQWNHYRVTCRDGAVTLEVNGKEVSGGHDCSPRKGYICLEAEGSECHFRNIRIQELPATGAAPEDTADGALGHESLYTGLDLAGWKSGDDVSKLWKPQDWRLICVGGEDGAGQHLWTQQEYGDFELICDWRWTDKPRKTKVPVIRPDGERVRDESGVPVEQEILSAGESGLLLRGSEKAEVRLSCLPIGSGEIRGYGDDPELPPELRAAITPSSAADRPIGQWNRVVVTLRGDRVTVELNGQVVVRDARLPGLPERGPIGLAHHGAGLEFANLYVRQLNE